MQIRELSILNFKNYQEANFTFGEGLNALLGPNGAGKTNLLDAVYYLCMARSAFSTTEGQNAAHGQKFFMLSGRFERQGHPLRVAASWQEQQKRLLLDGQEYRRLSDHIGLLPVVLMSPHDTDLVREGGELRRGFFDSMISQTDAHYLRLLIGYQQVLRQRNALLRQHAGLPPSALDADLLAPYDLQLVRLGEQLHARRRDFLADFEPLFQQRYAFLTQGQERVGLRYRSDAAEGQLQQLLSQSLERDLQLLRTSRGVHRDDYDFRLEGHALKRFGSQGQQKSYVIALKLAQYELMGQRCATAPLLLLDDILDKLDDARIGRLLAYVTQQALGQILLTDARPERTLEFLQAQGLQAHTIML